MSMRNNGDFNVQKQSCERALNDFSRAFNSYIAHKASISFVRKNMVEVCPRHLSKLQSEWSFIL